jgi:ATP-dependent DNA helicase Rep
MNPPQREAVKFLDGPLLVLAGAGSGKTRVITHKIAYLIDVCDIKAVNIAAITFTNKAAREMQERVGQLVEPARLKGLTVCTFHSLGMQILRQEAQHLGYKQQFSILDSADSMHILSEILKTTDAAEIKRTQFAISRWKNDMLSPGHAMSQAQDEREAWTAKVYEQYQDTLKAYQAVDFDDLIRLPVELFETQPTVLERWSNKLRYLLIDEYQDTNISQYKLVRMIAGTRGAFTAVGDDDQAIYAWRGASSENIANLQRDYPQLKVIKLEQNYRSMVRILRAANTLIANNPKMFEKKLWSDKGHGDPIHVLAAQNEEHEAETVVMRLQMHRFTNRTKYADYAILYRGNHQARVFEQYLRNERIPYQISGGSSFFDKSEIKNLIAYLRLLANPDDEPAFIRAITTPKRGIGATTLEKLGEYAAARNISLFAAVYEAGISTSVNEKQYVPLREFCDFIGRMELRAGREPAHQVMQDLLKAIDYELFLYDSNEARAAKAKWDNVLEFVGWIVKKGEEDGKTLNEVTQTIALINMLDNKEDEEVDAVRLSTLHASKGLEYPHVFLVGIEEGLLPHRESLEPAKVEEERRLMYVGITRAQKSLTISYCQKRKRGKEWSPCEPSRFIDELNQEDLQFSGRKTTDPVQQKKDGMERLAALKGMLKAAPK